MKLIDILVEELPKRGGWPEGYDFVCSEGPCGAVWAYKTKHCTAGKELYFHSPLGGSVTREQYESALAASKQAWNGEGLPPVGCECEYTLNNGGTWHECTVEYLVGTQGAVLSCDVYEGVQYVHFCNYDGKLFRPIRSEEEKKRDEAIAALKQFKPQLVGHLAGYLYDEIAEGKIPHIRIE